MELSPGFVTHEPMPFGPRISHAGLLEGLVEPLVNALGGGDAVLGAHQAAIANNTADGLEGTFASTVGVAADLAVNQQPFAHDQTANALVDAGAGTEAYRQSVLRYLPQPDAPIESDFRELPTPPAGPPPDPTSGGGDRHVD